MIRRGRAAKPNPGPSRAPALRSFRRRVLVVGDDRTSACIRNALDPARWDLTAVPTGSEGLVARRTLLPDAVLVDLSLPDMSGAEFCRQVTQRADAASIPIIVLGDDAGVSGRVASLRAGAFDYLVKPPDPAELVARLEAALDLRGESAGMIVVACGSKGGVGTSTVAVNCAASLCRQFGAAVVVDVGARMATADVLLNIQPVHDAASLLSRFEDLEADDIGSFLTPHASGLEVLLLPGVWSRSDGHSGLRRIVLALRRLRPFVIVDTPAGAPEWTAVSLELADVLLLVFTAEIASLRGAGQVLEQARAMGLAPERIRLVLNRYPLRGGLDRAAIENVLGTKVTHTVPDDVRLVTYSANRGLPLVLSHAHSSVARHLSAISAAVAEAAPPGDARNSARARAVFGERLRWMAR